VPNGNGKLGEAEFATMLLNVSKQPKGLTNTPNLC